MDTHPGARATADGLWLLCLLLAACGTTEAPPTHVDLSANSPEASAARDSTPDNPGQLDLAADETSVPDSGSAEGSPESGVADSTVTDAFPPPKPDSCIKNTNPGHQVHKCDGLTFDVTVPKQCLTSACGVVVDVHGLTMNAKMQDANTAMRALGNKYGYIVLQPNANGIPPLSSWSAADDVKVLAFIKRVMAVWHADPKRIHFTGFSQGGAMSWRFLCKHGDLLASVAPAAACSAIDTAAGCFGKGKKPKHQLPVMFMHGTKDVLVNYSCAKQVRDAVVAAWQLKQSKVLSQDASHKWIRYSGPKGAVFEFVSHDYAAKSMLIGGHCYPGSKDQSGGAPGQLFGFGCANTSAFTWGEIAIKFFIAHPR